MANHISSDMPDVVRATARRVAFEAVSQAICVCLCSRIQHQDVKQALDSVSGLQSTAHSSCLSCILYIFIFLASLTSSIHMYIHLSTHVSVTIIHVKFC